MSLCEWNPTLNEDAFTNPRPTDCKNQAEVRAGRHHLCGTCSKLPKFKRFKKWPLRERRTCSHNFKPADEEDIWYCTRCGMEAGCL